jgi:RNA polymerase-binding protein DksA
MKKGIIKHKHRVRRETLSVYSVVIFFTTDLSKRSLPMKRNDLGYFRNIILEKRQDVLRSISATELINLEKRTHPNGGGITQYSTHMADQGSDANQYELDNYFVARSLKFLRHLDHALTRIEKGDYGICVICHKEIPRERLEVVPHTQYCTQCKN